MIQEKKQSKKRNFHHRKEINVWYAVGMTVIFLLGAIFTRYQDPNNPYHDLAITSYWAFFVIQVFGWIAGLFKKEEANSFFMAFAIDMITHFMGAFALYLNFYLLLDVEIRIFTFLALLAGPFFEFFEFCMEILLTYIDSKSKKYKITYKKHISEPLGNVAQDIYFDALGVAFGFFLLF